MADGRSIEQRGAAGVIESRERIPVNPLRVGVSISGRWGGWGDIEHGLKIADRLAASPHFKTHIYTPSFATGIIDRIPKDIPTVMYERVKGQNITEFVADTTEDVIVSVCGAAVPKMRSDPVIVDVEEFGVRRTTSDNPKKIPISTGFQFDPDSKGTIQAGIPFSRKYAEILRTGETDRKTLIEDAEAVLSERIGSEVSLDGQDIGLFYISTLPGNYAYFDLLRMAQSHLKQPATIVAPVESRDYDERREEDFAKKMRSLGFNYLSPAIRIQTNSPVTVVNPHTVPNDTFLNIQAAANLPYVVTGDQSLAEAVQKSESGVPSPLLYYCTFVPKQADFLTLTEKIDPESTHILAAYYMLEAPNGKPILNAQYEDVRERYALRTDSHKKIASLFYDESMRSAYIRSLGKIRDQMVSERRNYVDDPETLTDVGATVEAVLEGIRLQDLDKIQRLITK